MKIDTTQVTDAEQMEYGVETLAQQRDRVKQMNRTTLGELMAQVKTIDQLVELIKAEPKKDPEIDVSEMSINSFGYVLMGENKIDEALKLFVLNTELYPEAYNAWDSYGECLLLLGNLEEGIEAYKKSLELNPENTNAEEIILQNKKK